MEHIFFPKNIVASLFLPIKKLRNKYISNEIELMMGSGIKCITLSLWRYVLHLETILFPPQQFTDKSDY